MADERLDMDLILDGRLVLEAIADPALVHGPCGRIQTANAAARGLFGLDPVGRPIGELLPEEPFSDAASYGAGLAAGHHAPVTCGGEAFLAVAREVGSNGVTLVVLRPRPSPTPGPPTPAETLLSRAIETLPDPLLIADPEGVIQRVNGAACDLFRYARGDLVGASLTKLMPEEHASKHGQYLERYQRTGEPRMIGKPRELLAQSSDGEQIPIRLSIGETTIDGEAVYVATCHDLRVVRRLEKELHQRQKMDALGQLASGVAHDFNNLLLVVLQNAALLEEELDGEHRELAAEIAGAGQRASEVSHQLLQFSRQDAVEARDVEVSPLLERFAGMLRRIVGVAHPIDVQAPSEPLFVRVDPGQLEQVLMNLVINARDAMPDGGTISVSAASRQTSDGPWVRFQVRDRGKGIDPEVLPNIFDPFFTTKERGTGTGLGLSTTWGIVRSAGGSIHVDSEPGRGTTFSVYLPPAEVSCQASERISSTGLQLAPIEDVLVTLVDDDGMVRNAVRRWLVRVGHQVRGFASGAEALAAFEGDTGNLGPQVLVTDVVMPHMGGPELARQLGERHPEIPVIFISGQPEDRLPAELGPRTRFLAKPFEPKHLSHLILELVNAALSDRAEES